MDTSPLLQQAIDAAVDIVLEVPVGLPPLPSSTSLCRTLGVGASTFHRLFGNTEKFHHEFLGWTNSTIYDAIHLDLVSVTVTGTRDELPPLAEDFGFLVGTQIATLFWGDLSDPILPEAVLYPWLTHDVVQGVMRASASLDINAEADALHAFLVSLGGAGDSVADMSIHCAEVLAASDVAVRLVTNSNGVAWPVPDLPHQLSTMEMTFGRTAAAIIGGYLSRDSADATDVDAAQR